MYKMAPATSSDVSPFPAATPSATAAASVTCHRSFRHDAWRNCADANARSDQLPAKAVSQRLHGVLGRGVHRFPVDCLMSRDEAGDNNVAGSSGDQVLQRRMDRAHHATDIGVNEAQ